MSVTAVPVSRRKAQQKTLCHDTGSQRVTRYDPGAAAAEAVGRSAAWELWKLTGVSSIRDTENQALSRMSKVDL